MEVFLSYPKSLRLLLLSDVDMGTVTKLSEQFIHLPPQFDAILVIGPFGLLDTNSQEEAAIALGDMASTLAQLENVVCRVFYLPTELEPARVLIDQLHLTPNSVNIMGRQLNLLDNLFVMGYSERSEKSMVPIQKDGEDETDASMEIMSGASLEHIQNLINSVQEIEKNESRLGMLAVRYEYSHTLNHLLFHMSEDLAKANIRVLIVSSSNDQELSRLPKKIGSSSLIGVKSLQKDHYSVLQLKFNIESESWEIDSVQNHQLM
jgi:hypothetical protein